MRMRSATPALVFANHENDLGCAAAGRDDLPHEDTAALARQPRMGRDCGNALSHETLRLIEAQR
jgi:hypothetical protein